MPFMFNITFGKLYSPDQMLLPWALGSICCYLKAGPVGYFAEGLMRRPRVAVEHMKASQKEKSDPQILATLQAMPWVEMTGTKKNIARSFAVYSLIWMYWNTSCIDSHNFLWKSANWLNKGSNNLHIIFNCSIYYYQRQNA